MGKHWNRLHRVTQSHPGASQTWRLLGSRLPQPGFSRSAGVSVRIYTATQMILRLSRGREGSKKQRDLNRVPQKAGREPGNLLPQCPAVLHRPHRHAGASQLQCFLILWDGLALWGSETPVCLEGSCNSSYYTWLDHEVSRYSAKHYFQVNL